MVLHRIRSRILRNLIRVFLLTSLFALCTFLLISYRFSAERTSSGIRNADEVQIYTRKHAIRKDVKSHTKLPCAGLYKLFSHINFTSPGIAGRLCEGHKAYVLEKGVYPPCRLSEKFDFDKGETFTKERLFHKLENKYLDIYTNSRADEFVSESIHNTHGWETDFVFNLLRFTLEIPDVTFVDIGSNIGVYSLQAASSGIRTIALDANIRNLVRLRKAAKEQSLKMLLLWNFVSEEPSLTHLRLPSDCNVGAAHNSELARRPDDVTDSIPVMTITADQLIGVIETPNVVMKIDIQGGEPAFLKAATKLFDKVTIPLLLMEWDYHEKFISEEQANDMLDFLTSRGFRPFHPGSLRPFLVEGWKHWPGIDVLWIPEQFLINNNFVFSVPKR